MSALSRYFEILSSVQLHRSQRGLYLSDQSAFYFAGKTTAFLPLCQGIAVLAMVSAIGRLFDVSALSTPVVRILCLTPFIAASAALLSNLGYLRALRAKIGAEPPLEAERRRRVARLFSLGSYLVGAVGLACLIALQVTRNDA
jgi:hypothetical protein